MLFNVCFAVTVECCVLYPCCVGVFAVMYRPLLKMLCNYGEEGHGSE